MKTNPDCTGSVLVLSATPTTLPVLLWRLVRDRDGRLIVLDLAGRGARCLDGVARLLEDRKVLWLDYANRLRPAPGLHFSGTDADRVRLERLLWNFLLLSGKQVTPEYMRWLLHVAGELAATGKVTLGALLRVVSHPHLRTGPTAIVDTEGFTVDRKSAENFTEALAWCLRFPLVAALAEGRDDARIQLGAVRHDLVWMEASSEYLERVERMLVNACMICEAVSIADENPCGDEPARFTQVLHLLPGPSVVQHWADHLKPRPNLRHVVVMYCNEGKIPAGVAVVAGYFQELWVHGPLKGFGATWLPQTMRGMLEKIGEDQLRVIPREGEPFGVRVRVPQMEQSTIQVLRRGSALKLPPTAVPQLGEWVAESARGLQGAGHIYARLADRDALFAAWQRMNKKNKDSRGVDGITIRQFAETLDRELDQLAGELATGTYRCQPLRQATMPKTDGGTRSLGIPCIRDRVVQMACLEQIEPLFEAGFSPFSFGFRPRRSAHHALAAGLDLMAGGRSWVLHGDIEKCFDSIDHDILMGLLSLRIPDAQVLDLIRQWFSVEVVDLYETWWNDLGVPQGESLSPLFANVYLDVLDQYFRREGIAFVRYADDLVCFFATEADAQAARGRTSEFLQSRLRLRFKEKKTHIVGPSGAFPFLGFEVSLKEVKILPDRISRAQEVVRDQLIPMGSAIEPSAWVEGMARFNAIVRGFRNYFSWEKRETIRNQLARLDVRTEELATTLLPDTRRHDDLWKQRERFALAAKETEPSDAQSAKVLRANFGRYPGERPAEVDGSFRNWGESPEQEMQKKASAAKPVASRKQDAWKTRREEGVLLEGGRLLILLHGCYVKLEGDALRVRVRKQDIEQIPLDGLQYVLLQGIGASISAELAAELANRSIPLALASSWGIPEAISTPVRSTTARLRRIQILRGQEPEVQEAGVRMIAAKIGNQRAVLCTFAKYRKHRQAPATAEIEEAIRDMGRCLDDLKGIAPSSNNWQAVVMGYEGRAAARYWDILRRMLPPKLGFEGRVGQGATDPVNMCLNYLYGILYTEVWRAVLAVGLDPYFGVLHRSGRDQGSLVFDMIEELRAPFVDRVILGMIGRGFVPRVGRHGRLKTVTRRQLARAFFKRWQNPIAWRSKKLAPARILEVQVRAIAGLFEGKKTYRPYKMKW
ncbi:CRISPR-associated endonuclease Cas1 [Myxococcota bacterium]|nr:CRISPR-associated endonuclease Cas1 [Myxococcota bacterium]